MEGLYSLGLLPWSPSLISDRLERYIATLVISVVGEVSESIIILTDTSSQKTVHGLS